MVSGEWRVQSAEWIFDFVGAPRISVLSHSLRLGQRISLTRISYIRLCRDQDERVISPMPSCHQRIIHVFVNHINLKHPLFLNI